MFALGAAVAALHGHAFDARRYALGQLAVTCFQLMTHYANDYFDYEADRANATPTRWSGGSRVLPNGELPRAVALYAAIVLAVIGIAVSIALPIGAWPILAAILVLAWEYSAPPLRLCASGWGEVTTAVVVTGLVPWLSFSLQAPDLRGSGTLLAATVAPALLQIAMLVAIEFPDAAGDAATGKRTLVVRFGAERAALLYVGLTVAAFVWIPIAALLALPAKAALLAAAPLPVAVWRISRIAEHRDRTAFERLTFFAVFLLVATATCELIGVLVVTWVPR
jgi:1,4-dihydroxy-2-naphthoate polyprenyltransferase